MFDIAIIGAGPVGYSAAFEAIRYGFSVVLFESDSIGGTCLNRGCIPTKYLLHVARQYNDAIHADDGLLFGNLKIDFSVTKSKMEEIIASLRNGLSDKLKKSGIEIINGNAAIKECGVIECGGKVYNAKNMIIASGSIPQPSMLKGGLSSDDILKLEEIPQKLHIIGGGPIAVEFAEIFNMMGCDVTISIRGERILRGWDKDIAIGLTQSMKKKGIRINKECDFDSIVFSDDEIILSAIGRKANIPISERDIFDVGKNGGIIVDNNLQTKTSGVFAAGDVIEYSSQLAHTAMDQGRQIVRFIAQGISIKEGSTIRCIYPDQEIATVGLTETDAREKGIDILVAKQTMYANARTVISTKERGFIKIVVGKTDSRILGAQLMCENAGELIAEFALAIDHKMTVMDMLKSVRPHPSYCEAIQDALRTMENKLDEV